MVEAARGAGPRARRRVQPPPARRHPDAQAGDRGGPARPRPTTRRRGGCGGPGSRRSAAGSRAPSKAGGGPLLDIGVHVLDYSLFLLGQPRITAVSASTYDLLGTRRVRLQPGSDKSGATGAKTFDVEDLATVFMRLEDGGTLLVEASWAAHRTAGDEFGITIYGTEGGAELIVRDMEPIGSLRIFTDEAGVAAETTLSPPAGHGPRRGRRRSSSSRSATGAAPTARARPSSPGSSTPATAQPRSGGKSVSATSRPPGASQRSASARARSGSRWKRPTRTARIVSKRRSPRSTSSTNRAMHSASGFRCARRRSSSASGRSR